MTAWEVLFSQKHLLPETFRKKTAQLILVETSMPINNQSTGAAYNCFTIFFL